MTDDELAAAARALVRLVYQTFGAPLSPKWGPAVARVEAALAGKPTPAAVEARVRTQVAAKALMAARDELATVAERLEAKGRRPGGKLHLGTAAGVRLACFRLVELADQAAAEPTGTPKEKP